MNAPPRRRQEAWNTAHNELRLLEFKETSFFYVLLKGLLLFFSTYRNLAWTPAMNTRDLSSRVRRAGVTLAARYGRWEPS